MIPFSFIQKKYGEWGYFAKLVKLDVKCNGDTILYVNGKHKMDITITVDIRNDKNQKLKLSPYDFADKLYLCDYETGNGVHWDWKLTDGSSNDATNESYGNLIYLYMSITCANWDPKWLEDTIFMAIGLQVPDIGAFDTSRNGTNTINQAKYSFETGTQFKSPKFFSIDIRRKIDYSTPDNISIVEGEFQQLGSNLGWSSRLGRAGPYKAHYDGRSECRVIYFRPNKSNTGQNKFKDIEIIHDHITNDDVCTANRAWGQNDEMCFELLPNDEKYSAPMAVMGSGWGIDEYHVNLWFPNNGTYKVDGQVWIEDTFYYYRFCPYVSDDSSHHSDRISIVLYKFILPVHSTRQCGWHDVTPSIKVKVTDLYENDGTFELIFKDHEYFNKPGLK